METAIRIGEDTDTVAAIGGGLLGARYGAAAIPTEWREAVHGWPLADDGSPSDHRALAGWSASAVGPTVPEPPAVEPPAEEPAAVPSS